MAVPRYTEDELWERVRDVWRGEDSFFSLVRKNRYVMLGIDDLTRDCSIRYESGNVMSIPFEEVYALYRELYDRGNLPRNHLRNPVVSMRVVGRRSWHAPGAAMYALLPLLDDAIRVADGGHLFLRT